MPRSRIPITHAPIDQLRRRRDTERSFALGLANIVRSSSKIMSCEPSRRPVDDTHTVDHPTDTAQRIGFRRASGSIESVKWRVYPWNTPTATWVFITKSKKTTPLDSRSNPAASVRCDAPNMRDGAALGANFVLVFGPVQTSQR